MNEKITIGFHYVDENNDVYDSTSILEVCEDLGDTILDAIGRQMNALLKQAGFFRTNDNIFMQDLNDDEFDAVAEFLEDYRKEKKKGVQ